MQVGTTLPQVVFMGTGAPGQGANGMAWALQLDLQFQVPVYMLHLGTPKASVPWGCHVLSRRRTVLPARTT